MRPKSQSALCVVLCCLLLSLVESGVGQLRVAPLSFAEITSRSGGVSSGPSPTDLLKEQLATVEASQAEVNGLLNTFKSGIAREQAYEIRESDKAKKEAMSRNYQNTKFKRLQIMALVREKRRRIEVQRCLGMLRGGRDAVYNELANLFAATQTELLCPVLKAFEFPDLTLHGFHEEFYSKYKLGNIPKTDGSQTLFYQAAKSVVWRCMCEEKPQALSKPFKKPKLAVESELEKAAREASADVQALVPKPKPVV